MAKMVLKVGDPVKDLDNDMVLTSRTPIDSRLDIRDRLSELVGKGNTLSADDKAAIFGALTANMGRDKAMKIMNHAYLFNQRPDMANMPIEEKLKSFYTVGSNDPDVNDVISKSKSLGYGVLPGFRESSSSLNQILAGKIGEGQRGISVDPSIKKRVALRVNK